MVHIILLRGVTPNGKNAIPKMSYLVDILIEADFQHVRTYIQSGNIILESDLSLEEIREQVHTLIKEKIGADLKMVIKNKNDFAKIVQENPFGKHYLFDRIHVILFQNDIQSLPLEKLDSDYGYHFEKGSHLFGQKDSVFQMGFLGQFLQNHFCS